MAGADRDTYFASAKRTGQSEIHGQFARLQEDATLAFVLNAMPQHVAILDQNHQIVAANTKLAETFGDKEIDQVQGLRAGELIGCKHSLEMFVGCGTSEACRTCGATEAILSAQRGQAATNTCQINVSDSGDSPLDLKVTATPVQLNGAPWSYCPFRTWQTKTGVGSWNGRSSMMYSRRREEHRASRTYRRKLETWRRFVSSHLC